MLQFNEVNFWRIGYEYLDDDEFEDSITNDEFDDVHFDNVPIDHIPIHQGEEIVQIVEVESDRHSCTGCSEVEANKILGIDETFEDGSSEEHNDRMSEEMIESVEGAGAVKIEELGVLEDEAVKTESVGGEQMTQKIDTTTMDGTFDPLSLQSNAVTESVGGEQIIAKIDATTDIKSANVKSIDTSSTFDTTASFPSDQAPNCSIERPIIL